MADRSMNYEKQLMNAMLNADKTEHCDKLMNCTIFKILFMIIIIMYITYYCFVLMKIPFTV